MHQLSYLRVKNFRACKDVTLPLESYTPLVGQNNVGKSTILESIQWVLKPKALKETDFFDSSKPLEVVTCISGITEGLLERIPEPKHRKAIEPYCANGVLWIRVVATGASTKSFKPEVYDHEKYMGEGEPSDWRDYPTGLPQAVSVLLPEPLYIEAMDDIGEDLGKAKAGSTIKALLDEIMEPVLKAHDDLNRALETIRHILATDGKNRSGHLIEFDQAATKTLEQFFPGLTLDLDLQVVDVKEFFKAGDLHVTDKLTGDRRKFDQVGTGAQRAIQMSLIRYLAQTRLAGGDNPARRLLLIDEPEIYLHPQGTRRIRQALLTLSQAGFQVVFSTHSPLMLSRENAVDTVIVRKDKDAGVVTHKPLRHAVQTALQNAAHQSRTLFELGNLAEIYFSERVILCEGKTDRRLLPLAYQRLYGQPMELDHTTVVSLGSCSDIPKALPVLGAMGIKACAIADLDFAFTGARKSGMLPEDDEHVKAATALLKELQAQYGYDLADNGLPRKNKDWSAANIWAILASHERGTPIAFAVHQQLAAQGVWVWPQGCIEHVTGEAAKGEDAIATQEEQLCSMSPDDIAKSMPEFGKCFAWVKSF